MTSASADRPPASDGPAAGPPREVHQRSWLEIRWRQFRNAPTPIVRAVTADLAVAVVGGLALLGYDLALSRGIPLPGGDLRTLAFVGFVALVVGAGSVLSYLWVPLPAGPSGPRRRSLWSGLLGFFAALPIAYLVLVLAFQVIRPLLGP
ncbi:MAG: hypothetical protein ACXWQ6_07310 [Candidatus Limnocylindrales bacterium]